jgi:(2S)-methylsuccinyl-CoA dehydrogenase
VGLEPVRGGASGASLATCSAALDAAERHVQTAAGAVLQKVAGPRGVDAALFEREQSAAHGYAWIATYVCALRALLGWARALDAGGRLHELERLILVAGFGEYLAQLMGGIALSQAESVRPGDLGIEEGAAALATDAVRALVRERGNPDLGRRICALIDERHGYGEAGLGDPALQIMAGQIRRYVDEVIAPQAQGWHRADALIPDEVLRALAEMGVFGVSVPESYGGLGLGKVAMCVVTEELSRGYLGVGSLGTRSEIAAELIGCAGTAAQKQRWLPGIASGAVLPTAVFTEPGTGSDLANLQTRARRQGEGYTVTGNKTWITHASRSDLMTLLARTGSPQSGYRGLSMFLVEKPRGTVNDPFPLAGLTGSEIRVLGYRGMEEYELAFDALLTPAQSLLGGVEGQGFKQLMATFESARIQTAARAVGVAQNALELGMQYARQRVQFGKPIIEFPRISGKLGWMAVETMLARQLALFAAREKDKGRRCDIEAGMAKLLAARVAWSNADCALQVHGGNGYAEEYPISRVLCDARILSIFEGAAEIQAGVIARGLLTRETAS